MKKAIKVEHHSKNISGNIKISGSKSQSNRWLILHYLYGFPFRFDNLSNSEDTLLLQEALNSSSKEIDIHHAGTAMRFLTSYFSIQKGREIVLKGSDIMHNRPIGSLVEALKDLGAEIYYLNKIGYPPIHIKGKSITKNTVKIKANVSSQFISSLLLIAPKLSKGLNVYLQGDITSFPYIAMTIKQLNSIGIRSNIIGNKIQVMYKGQVSPKNILIESDWSSASYFFSMVALAKNASLTLSRFNDLSNQGDSRITEIYKQLGVQSSVKNGELHIRKCDINSSGVLNFNFTDCPDIAQTVAITCFGLRRECKITGLHTLKIKETDRLVALKNEVNKLGGNILISENSLHIFPSNDKLNNSTIETYEDHRMAMSFVPLALKQPIRIKNPEVVSKSYPNFWYDCKKLGFKF